MSSSATTTTNPNPPPPPGFQLLFKANNPALQQQQQSDSIAIHTPFNYITLPIHWSIIRTPHPHNYRLISGSEVFSETLPRDWIPSCVKREKEEGDGGTKFIELFYKDVSPGGEVLRVKIVETVVDKEVAVSVSAAGGDGGSGGGGGVRDEAGLITVADYLVNGGRDLWDRSSSNSVGGIYNVAGLWVLEGVVQKLVTGESRIPDAYASKIPPARLKQLQEEKEERRRLREEQDEQSRSTILPQPPRSTGGIGIGSTFPDPLRPDIGRSDLDPFSSGGIGVSGGGMLMDPRGFRRPQLPQGIVPGARFDPIGPSFGGGGGGMGGLGGRGGRGGGIGAPRLPFGFPDPDHERAPGGYEDMFM